MPRLAAREEGVGADHIALETRHFLEPPQPQIVAAEQGDEVLQQFLPLEDGIEPGFCLDAEHAIEAPNNANVRFRDMVTVSLGGTGTIRHVVNDRGGPSNSTTNVANLVSYP